MQCIIMENTLIKLIHHDETKKRAHDSQIVRAKENLKLSLVWAQLQISIINLATMSRLAPMIPLLRADTTVLTGGLGAL